MSIGPTLPPHLQKKAGPERASDDEDAYGPSLPSSAAVGPARPPSSAPSSVGPSLPPHLQSKSAPPPEDDDEDDSSIGPALPPHLLKARSSATTAGPSRPPVSGPSRPTVGPAPPPSSDYPLDSDSDDEIVGPLPSYKDDDANASSAVRDFQEREERWRKEREEAKKPKVLKREEWMLKPPEAGDILSNLDPTKIPGRQTTFNRVSAAPIKAEDQSLWTETPAERQERLADEVSGKRKRAEISHSSGGGPKDDAEADDIRRRKKRDKELKAEIDAHNSKTRNMTLLEQHAEQAKKRKKKDDEPQPIWDRDLHMSVGGKLMDDKDRKAQILDAKGLGSRFGHGKSGAFS